MSPPVPKARSNHSLPRPATLGASPQTPGVFRFGPMGQWANGPMGQWAIAGQAGVVARKLPHRDTRHRPLWRAPAAPVALRQSRILRATNHAP